MIETFNINTIWNRRGKPPVVQISKWGHIRFSVEAVKLLCLKEGMKLSFTIDHRDKGIIYFYQSTQGMPLHCGAKTKTGERLEIYCRPLSLKLLSFFCFSRNKTFRTTNEKITVPGATEKAWFILKDNIHKPLKWKKHAAHTF
jgi:hypothetical protein